MRAGNNGRDEIPLRVMADWRENAGGDGLISSSSPTVDRAQAESVPVTGSMLYDLVACPHRLHMDRFADPAERGDVSPFVQLLWKKGALYENEVMAGPEILFTDLSGYYEEEQERKTREAMRRGDALIYSGRIRSGELLGIPDLLRREGGGYLAGDIKSGAGAGGTADLAKPKTHYAVQLALYTDILERTGFSAGRKGFIWDIHGNEVDYDFSRPQSARNPVTLWEEYETVLSHARAILSGRGENACGLRGPSASCAIGTRRASSNSKMPTT